MSVWSAAAVDNLRCVAEALEADIANGPLVPDVSPRAIREHLASRYSFAAPMALGDAVADVERMLREWHVQVTHPRSLGLFNPSVTFASIVGDAMAAMFNPQLATWRTSPAANAIERHTLGWLAGTLGLPPDVHATFTTGGAEANLSAVVVALTRACPEYGERGVSALPAPPSLYLTDGAHDSFRKIAHMTGVGRAALRTVAMDADFRMDLTDLARQVSHDRRTGRQPLLVIGTAGTTSAGAIDPLADLAAFCRRERLWFHVDAAWGGAAVLSPRLRPHLAGIDAADSITCDAHKWFSVPMSAGMFFCRHVDAVRDAFRVQTAYMPGTTGGVDDPYTTTVQWSRRFIGLKLFLAIAER